MRLQRFAAMGLVLALLGVQAGAEEVREYKVAGAEGAATYVAVPLENLKLTQGELSEEEQEDLARWVIRATAGNGMRVILEEGAGEAYVQPRLRDKDGRAYPPMMVARLDKGTSASGRMWLWDKSPEWSREPAKKAAREIRFKIDAKGARARPTTWAAADGDAKSATPKEMFRETKAAYYRELVQRQVPGASYFRHELGKLPKGGEEPANRWMPRPSGGMEDTYTLFTGGRAVAESLQLERVVPTGTRPTTQMVDVSTIAGITVREFDWAPVMKKVGEEAADPLAGMLPADQHAIFFPSFESMTAVMDEANGSSTPVLQGLETRSEDAMTKERYQKQLGLDMSALGRLLGPAVIGSVAITGSDPYLRMGSDLAVVFEAKGDPRGLEMLLAMQIGKNTGVKGSAVLNGDLRVAPRYTAWATADRTVSSYLAVVGKAVVVSNSPQQLERLSRVKENASLGSLPEYKFFRNRYKRGDADESALIVLTDATIRRWCSPGVRIGDSRRMRAAAVLADAEASQIAEPGSKYTPPGGFDLGKMTIEKGRAVSSVYGSMEFMTPLGELGIQQVTEDEAREYGRWRDEYQTFYRRYFDPIAIRLSVKKSRLAADVTVMPLIESSMYHEVPFGIAGRMQFSTNAADPRDPLAQMVIAVDKTSAPFVQMMRWMDPVEAVRTVGWIGRSVSVYVEDDPFWEEMAKAESPEKFLEKNYARLPIAVRAEVSNPVLLAAFVTKMREDLGRVGTRWEQRKHAGQTYMKVSSDEGRGGFTVYYVTSPDLLVSMNEKVVQRAIDRRIALATQPAATRPATAGAGAKGAWLGASAAFKADRRGIGILVGMLRDQYRVQMQGLAWSALPILNELKRLHPEEDAVEAYAWLFHARLLEPAGGKYVWNKERATYESTVYGSPESPREGPGMPGAVGSVKSVNLGFTFEGDGLRARAEVEREDR